MHSGSSKIYKKQSSIIRSVHDLNSFSMLTKTTDGTTNDCWESRIQLNSECPLVRLGKTNDPLDRTRVRSSFASVFTMEFA